MDVGEGVIVRKMADGQLEVVGHGYIVRARFSSSAHSTCHVNFVAKKLTTTPVSGMTGPVGLLGKTAVAVDVTEDDLEMVWENDEVSLDDGIFGLSAAAKSMYDQIEEVGEVDEASESISSWVSAAAE